MFCNTCKDARTVAVTVKCEWKDEEYKSIPCPDCSTPIERIPCEPLPRGPEPLTPAEIAHVMGVAHNG
jgi:hypothetical protein